MKNLITCTTECPEHSCFATDDIAASFKLAKSKDKTDYYFCGAPHQIYGFATMMYEGLTCGFMHYHLPSEYHAYFIDKYPELAQPVNQIHYIYTDENHRRQGVASALLDYISLDMQAKSFRYIWLRCEIDPKLYYSKGFLTFSEALQAIYGNHFDAFVKDYEDKVQKWGRLNRSFGELRLVKIL